MILEKIVRHKRHEVAERKSRRPLELLKKSLPQTRGEFKSALGKEGVSLIAEVKKASPSKGVFREDFDPVKIATSYEKAGAAAISVLTDSEFFQGSLQDLKKVKESVQLPVLRKDFIIDPYQIYEAKYSGADAILLIAAVLDEKQLTEFLNLAGELELDALVEVHSREELKVALRSRAEIIGINNRDLTTFNTDIKTTLELAKFVPEGCILVSESGISSGEDVKRLAQAGVDAILVGEALVTSSEIDAKIKELIGV
ncbi:MAG: indole-3-glycerol phosphate synthase [Clostridia bacterium]|nr:indole-3-glycerol phosphate synthase [Clostridia bacterium]